MPKLIEVDSEAEHLEAVIAARAEFAEGFKRNRKGNLWRHWEGKMVTVFRRDDRFYGWCIASPAKRRFSSGRHDCEEDAMSGLASELDVG
jgi:hypothetical protein